MADKTKENDLSTFLTDFADGLRELYPEKKANNEKIKPENFADLIAPDKYQEGLKPENIRAKDDDGNPISIFGVTGTAEALPPSDPIIDFENSGWVLTTGENLIGATVPGTSISTTKALSKLDTNFKAENIIYGVTIQNIAGTYMNLFGDAVIINNTKNNGDDPTRTLIVTYYDSNVFHENLSQVEIPPNESAVITPPYGSYIKVEAEGPNGWVYRPLNGGSNDSHLQFHHVNGVIFVYFYSLYNNNFITLDLHGDAK